MLPTALPDRRVPFVLRDKFAAELSNLVHLGVIINVKDSVNYVGQVAMVMKRDGNGGLKLYK